MQASGTTANSPMSHLAAAMIARDGRSRFSEHDDSAKYRVMLEGACTEHARNRLEKKSVVS